MSKKGPVEVPSCRATRVTTICGGSTWPAWEATPYFAAPKLPTLVALRSGVLKPYQRDGHTPELAEWRGPSSSEQDTICDSWISLPACYFDWRRGGHSYYCTPTDCEQMKLERASRAHGSRVAHVMYHAQGGFRGALTGFAVGFGAASAYGYVYLLREYHEASSAMVASVQELQESTHKVTSSISFRTGLC